MFEGFIEEMRRGDGTGIFVRRGGADGAPPLALLHGYPQTSAMWHKVAPILARDYQVVAMDLRGYGRSGKPPSGPDHAAYSKRAMARDVVAVMTGLGHERFLIGAHDRGARVAHRLGLDHPDRVAAMMLLDIAPTREMYAGTDRAFAEAYWHWFFLIQPAPLPERIIGADPRGFWRAKCLNLTRGINPFAPEALEEYLSAFEDPEAIRATCEDYRAAASIDIAHDEADGGRKLHMPVFALWAEGGVIARCFDAHALWASRASDLVCAAMGQTHYLPEEIPGEIAAQMADFFGRRGGFGPP